MSRMLLYHTGYQIIQTPDIDRGRKNADLGQGFYTTPDLAFAHRWAQFRKGETVLSMPISLRLKAWIATAFPGIRNGRNTFSETGPGKQTA